jgi:hypothetical protein
VKAEEFAKIFRFFDSLSFSNDQALCVDDFVVLQINLGIVVEVKDLLERTKVLLGGAVTLETPSHRVTLGMVNFLHFVDLAVAAHAGNSAIEVSRVVEVDVIRSLVDADPFDGLAVDRVSTGVHDRTVKFIDPHGRTKSCELGRAFLNVLVTIPASVCGRHVRVTGMLNKAVAVTAIQTQLTHVEIVVKMNGLSGLVADSLSLGSCIVSDSGNYAGS